MFKTTSFLLGGVILVQILAYGAEKIAPDGNARFLSGDQRNVQWLLDRSQVIEAIAIGNSHNAAIDFETMGYNGGGIVRASSDFFETAYYLEKLIPKFPKVKTVFISVSYFSFHQNNTLSKELRIRRTHMYATVSSWQLIEGDFKYFVIGKSHPVFPISSIVRKDHWKDVLYANFHSIKEEKLQKEIASPECYNQSLDDLMEHAEYKAYEHIKLTSEVFGNDPAVDIAVHETMVSIVQALQERNIRIIFYTPPYFETYTRLYQLHDPEIIVSMKQHMQVLQKEYDIEYYDFSVDEEFIENSYIFANSDHLNRCGARLFSEKFKRVIAEN